ncbi:hypothetical protein QEJ31_01065 [Pigmentibacter sp. JX0631]|uniref:hypothetical protein n=1 Tax=Pigmentibacter sp. JX0631 TaxID=2976982 RepID=UPI002468DB6F|nr:hypothetical protein [Pigmentibacter sp. JX0631]WGL60193.1 hypothetical protein QEJ31_01065 [Pigmentibacter sp. JX0631]
MTNSLILFSFKKNEFISIEDFLNENTKFLFTFKNDIFFVKYNGVEMFVNYNTCFYLDSNIYILLNKNSNNFIIEDSIEKNFFLEYNLIEYLKKIIYFLTVKDVLMVFLIFRNLIVIIFLTAFFIKIIFFEKNETKYYELNNNSEYSKEYIIEKNILKLINEKNKE